MAENLRTPGLSVSIDRVGVVQGGGGGDGLRSAADFLGGVGDSAMRSWHEDIARKEEDLDRQAKIEGARAGAASFSGLKRDASGRLSKIQLQSSDTIYNRAYNDSLSKMAVTAVEADAKASASRFAMANPSDPVAFSNSWDTYAETTLDGQGDELRPIMQMALHQIGETTRLGVEQNQIKIARTNQYDTALLEAESIQNSINDIVAAQGDPSAEMEKLRETLMGIADLFPDFVTDAGALRQYADVENLVEAGSLYGEVTDMAKNGNFVGAQNRIEAWYKDPSHGIDNPDQRMAVRAQAQQLVAAQEQMHTRARAAAKKATVNQVLMAVEKARATRGDVGAYQTLLDFAAVYATPGATMGEDGDNRPIIVDAKGGLTSTAPRTVAVPGGYVNIPTIYEGQDYASESDKALLAEVTTEDGAYVDPETSRVIPVFATEAEAIDARVEEVAAAQKDPGFAKAAEKYEIRTLASGFDITERLGMFQLANAHLNNLQMVDRVKGQEAERQLKQVNANKVFRWKLQIEALGDVDDYEGLVALDTEMGVWGANNTLENADEWDVLHGEVGKHLRRIEKEFGKDGEAQDLVTSVAAGGNFGSDQTVRISESIDVLERKRRKAEAVNEQRQLGDPGNRPTPTVEHINYDMMTPEGAANTLYLQRNVTEWLPRVTDAMVKATSTRDLPTLLHLSQVWYSMTGPNGVKGSENIPAAITPKTRWFLDEVYKLVPFSEQDRAAGYADISKRLNLTAEQQAAQMARTQQRLTEARENGDIPTLEESLYRKKTGFFGTSVIEKGPGGSSRPFGFALNLQDTWLGAPLIKATGLDDVWNDLETFMAGGADKILTPWMSWQNLQYTRNIPPTAEMQAFRDERIARYANLYEDIGDAVKRADEDVNANFSLNYWSDGGSRDPVWSRYSPGVNDKQPGDETGVRVSEQIVEVITEAWNDQKRSEGTMVKLAGDPYDMLQEGDIRLVLDPTSMGYAGPKAWWIQYYDDEARLQTLVDEDGKYFSFKPGYSEKDRARDAAAAVVSKKVKEAGDIMGLKWGEVLYGVKDSNNEEGYAQAVIDHAARVYAGSMNDEQLNAVIMGTSKPGTGVTLPIPGKKLSIPVGRPAPPARRGLRGSMGLQNVGGEAQDPGYAMARQEAEKRYPFLSQFRDVKIKDAPAGSDNKGGLGEYHSAGDDGNPYDGTAVISIGSRSKELQGGVPDSIIADMVHVASDRSPVFQALKTELRGKLSPEELALAKRRYEADYRGKFSGSNFSTFENFLMNFWLDGTVQDLLLPENSEIEQFKSANPEARATLKKIKALFEGNAQ
jgi:hypothetical protein